MEFSSVQSLLYQVIPIYIIPFLFIYLNNNEKGQTVVNPKDGKFVSFCTRGSILLFPPLWPWMHTGMSPIDTPKYIVGSYLHYP